MFSSLTDTLKLSSGYEIPCVGFGTYLTPDGDTCVNSVKAALAAGYRHIDTAEFYMNEDGVGRGIARSGVPRGDIFVTTKVWNTHQGYDSTLAAFDASLKKLGLDYLDLYLVHWPVAKDFADDYRKGLFPTWRAMERLVDEGLVRTIGVCNSLRHHLETLFGECNIPPAVNQIEFHFGFADPDQLEAAEFSKANGMVVEAWAPLCRGRAFGNPVLKAGLARFAGQIDLYPSSPFFIEAVPLGVAKDRSLAALLDRMGLSPAQLMACGDGMNDRSMIRYAGVGVAMANAEGPVKAAANYVTTADNNHDGVAEAVERFILTD